MNKARGNKCDVAQIQAGSDCFGTDAGEKHLLATTKQLLVPSQLCHAEMEPTHKENILFMARLLELQLKAQFGQSALPSHYFWRRINTKLTASKERGSDK